MTRLAVLAVTGWVVFTVVVNLPAILPGATSSGGGGSASARSPVPATPFAVARGGRWTVAGLPWQVEVLRVEAAELPDRLACAPFHGGAGSGGDAEEDAWLLEMARQLGVRNRTQDGLIVYALDRPSLKIRWFVREEAEAEVLVGGYVACPRGPTEWTVLAAARATGPDSGGRERGPMLPLPAGSRRVCARWGPAGELQCDVVGLSGLLDPVLDRWRRHGWRVERPGWGRSEGLVFQCWRNGRQIQVRTFGDDAGSGEMFLVMIDTDSLVDRVWGQAWAKESRR